MLQQSLSFADATQDDSGIASPVFCAILEKADNASSVLGASDEEQESKEERSQPPDDGLIVFVTSNLRIVLVLSLSSVHFMNLCFFWTSVKAFVALQLLVTLSLTVLWCCHFSQSHSKFRIY